MTRERRNSVISRRDSLRSGVVLGSLAVPPATNAKVGSKQACTSLSPIYACILIFYYGGPSHLETYDPKPDAPTEIRGEFKTIATSVPGLRIGEYLPYMSRVMHKVAIVRSMSHGYRLHDSASMKVLTGREPPQGDFELLTPAPQLFPSYGAAVSHMKRDQNLAGKPESSRPLQAEPPPARSESGGGGGNAAKFGFARQMRGRNPRLHAIFGGCRKKRASARQYSRRSPRSPFNPRRLEETGQQKKIS